MMDFSPYKKKRYTSRPSLSSGQSKTMKYIYIALSIVLGVLFVWFIQSLFDDNEGISVYSTYQKNTSEAESQMKNAGVWSSLLENSPIIEGDTVRVLKGNDAKIIVQGGSYFLLGEKSELYVEKMRKRDDGQLFGDIKIEQTPVLFVGKNEFPAEEEFKIWVSEDTYVVAGHYTFLCDDGLVSVVDGNKILVRSVDANGKIEQQKDLGIGQSLNVVSFTLQATEDALKSSELVAEYKGESLLDTISEENIEESKDLDSPIITNPEFEGSAITVKGGKQKISGTASLDTEKIIIVFSNGSQTEELKFIPSLSDDETSKEWSYTASPEYKTLLEGVNTYKIYALNADNKRSAVEILLLSYDKDMDDEEGSSGNEDGVNSDGGEFAITAPNQGRDTELEGDTVVLNGVATENTAYVTIENTTLDTSYTLKKYSKGQKTWKYWMDELKPDTYEYVVYAKDEDKKVIHTAKISITLTEEEAEDIPLATSTITPTPASSATSSPVVTTSASDSSSQDETQTSTPTPTPAPLTTIKPSTLEISR